MKNNTINYKKILLTHDGSKLASAAIPHAVAIAKQFNAEVVLLRVVDDIIMTVPNVSYIGSSQVTAEMSENITASEKHVARNHLYRLKKQLMDQGITNVSTYVKTGEISEEILQFINKNKFDLVVMSTHGSSGIKRAILGSVADEVMRHAPCAVLLIHPLKGVH